MQGFQTEGARSAWQQSLITEQQETHFSSPFWQNFGFKPNAHREPINVNERKGVGYLTETL